jgi:hypothetical protein
MKAGFDRPGWNGIYLLAVVYRNVSVLLEKRFCWFDSPARAPIVSVAVEFPVLIGCEVPE